MTRLAKMTLAWKALRELGLVQLSQYASYQISLGSGGLRRATQDGERAGQGLSSLTYLRPLLVLPGIDSLNLVLGDAGLEKLINEADEIVAGRVRLFGGEAVPLQLTCPKPIYHWTAYELGKASAVIEEQPDIKLIWEPGRFGWAFTSDELIISAGMSAMLRLSGNTPGYSWTKTHLILDRTGSRRRKWPCV